MPFLPDPNATIPSSDFTMQGNPDMHSQQANETFLLTASKGAFLGSGGEMRGFAKFQYQPDMTLDAPTSAAWAHREKLRKGAEAGRFFTAREEAKRISNNELKPAQRQIDAAVDDQARKAAQQELDDLKASLEQHKQTIAALVDRPEIQEYLKAEAAHKELSVRLSQRNMAAESSSSLFRKAERDNMGQNTPTVGGDRSMLSRAVASTLVDNFLGMGVLAEERFSGNKEGRPMGISVQAEGAGIMGQFGGKECFLDIDYADPKIQKGLSDLEINDFITGQIDRGPTNIFVDPITKKVTGIDNDLAFPECSRDEAISQGGRGKAIKGAPLTIHKETADKILSLDPKKLRKQLQNMPAPNGTGKLSDASIDGAVDRLKQLQSGIKSGTIKQVDQFNKQTYDDAIAEQNKVVKKEFFQKEISQITNDSVRVATKTSYLGTVAIFKHTNELSIRELPEEFGKRPENSVKSIERDPRVVAYHKMDAAGKKQFEKTASELDKLQKQFSMCQQKQEQVNTKLKGLKGVAGYIEKPIFEGELKLFQKQEDKLREQLVSKMTQLENLVGATRNANQLQQAPKPSTDLQLNTQEAPGPKAGSDLAPEHHSVRTELQHDGHAELQPSLKQSVKTQQQQKAEEHHSLRQEHPEIHAPGGDKNLKPQHVQHV